MCAQVTLERLALLAMMARARALEGHAHTGAPYSAILKPLAEASHMCVQVTLERLALLAMMAKERAL